MWDPSHGTQPSHGQPPPPQQPQPQPQPPQLQPQQQQQQHAHATPHALPPHPVAAAAFQDVIQGYQQQAAPHQGAQVQLPQQQPCAPATPFPQPPPQQPWQQQQQPSPWGVAPPGQQLNQFVQPGPATGAGAVFHGFNGGGGVMGAPQTPQQTPVPSVVPWHAAVAATYVPPPTYATGRGGRGRGRGGGASRLRPDRDVNFVQFAGHITAEGLSFAPTGLEQPNAVHIHDRPSESMVALTFGSMRSVSASPLHPTPPQPF